MEEERVRIGNKMEGVKKGGNKSCTLVASKMNCAC